MRDVAMLILLLPVGAAAQTPVRLTLPPPSMAAETRQPAELVLSASLAAHGGTPLLSIQSVTLRGNSASGRTVQPIAISATMEGSSRIDWGNPVQRTLVTTTQGRYEVRAGTRFLRSPHSGAHASLDVFSVLGIRNTYGSGSNRGLVGPALLGGSEVFRVHAGTDRQQQHYDRVLKDEADVDFDPQTGLVAAIHRREYADESLDLVFVSTHKFSDYRPVAGVLLPFHIARYSDGRLKETIEVESYEINPVFDRDLFER